ncbi:adenosine deaminase [Lysobacter sp. K5869]|uniref:adenosine deaminase n=1 Tax=Lysobacter sp. K5869 TaxID=2820808 RepID=UPI001C05F442|nr:adenosine deaminase [Lysobacter sp. K5869]QWP77597.1 adenosine deaminase [Lysobacter sp. K5869]
MTPRAAIAARTILHGALLAAALAGAAHARERAPDDAEAATAAYFDRLLASPPRLRAFVQAMPKGGDLHSHLSGAVYAEDYLRWAGEDGLCLQREDARLVAPPCKAPASVAVNEAPLPLYGRAIDAMSVRGYERGVGDAQVPVEQRFFSAFDRFRTVARERGGDMLAAVRAIAAGENTAYLELMLVPPAGRDFSDAAPARQDGEDFAAWAASLQRALAEAVPRARAELDGDEARAAAVLACAGAAPRPGCAVETRYQISATRTHEPARVFAGLAFAFALAAADPRCVGVNLVGPEHQRLAASDYALHMRMVAFFKQRYPQVNVSLHAGELVAGLAPPGDLRAHIRQAVDVAGAQRIGHGVALAYEDDPAALLRRMARDKIAVEINLSSNAAILGVRGAAHPLALYRAAGVPVVLSTDDQGVLRGDLSGEYQRAALEQGLRYRDLKRIARDSLQYAFLSGASLWRDEAGGARAAACAGGDAGGEPDAACAAFLRGSDKARLQWRLERQWTRFERQPRLPLDPAPAE